jgi:hypothetical protein
LIALGSAESTCTRTSLTACQRTRVQRVLVRERRHGRSVGFSMAARSTARAPVASDSMGSSATRSVCVGASWLPPVRSLATGSGVVGLRVLGSSGRVLRDDVPALDLHQPSSRCRLRGAVFAVPSSRCALSPMARRKSLGRSRGTFVAVPRGGITAPATARDVRRRLHTGASPPATVREGTVTFRAARGLLAGAHRHGADGLVGAGVGGCEGSAPRRSQE